MSRSLLLVALCALVIATNAKPSRHPTDAQDIDMNALFGSFHLVNADRVFDAEPVEKALLRFKNLRALPIMKKSIAIGRAGFRPGKRSIDIYNF